MAEMLLYLMMSDLWEFTESDLREFLESMLSQPCANEELIQEISAQVDAANLDRERIAGWPERFPELLPPALADYPEAVEHFETVLEQVGDEDLESRLLARFEKCMTLVDVAQGWEARSQAARGVASMEEEVDRLRTAHLNDPIPLAETSPISLVSWRFTLDGLNQWQDAFRLTHLDKLDEAFECALEGSRLLRAVQKWSEAVTEMVILAVDIAPQLPELDTEIAGV